MKQLEATLVKPLCRMGRGSDTQDLTHREMALQVLEKYLADFPTHDVAGSVLAVRDPQDPNKMCSWWRVVIEQTAGGVDKYDIELALGVDATTPVYEWEM